MADGVPASPAIRLPSITDKYILNEAALKGTGGFSRVIVGTEKTPTASKRAIKVMAKADLQGKKKMEMVTHEKEILRRTRHNNIIYLHECVETDTQVFMVLDLMETDLFEYIKKAKKLTERDAAHVMRGLMRAVAYLHANNIVHRDIKPENILINTPEDIKLADFGLAKLIHGGSDFVANTPCGTSFYIAPEIIKGIEREGPKPQVTTRENLKFVDVWSSGIVLYILLSGRPPFVGQIRTKQERQQLLSKIDKGVLFPDTYWDGISEEAKDLVLRMLTLDTDKRITAVEALRHPFLATADNMSPDNGLLQTPMVLSGMTREEFSAKAAEMQAACLEAHGDDAAEPSPPHVEEKINTVPAAPKVPTGKIQMTSNLMERRKQEAQAKQQQQVSPSL